MKAALYDRYGSTDVLQVREREVPTFRSHELLVRVHAAAVNPKDILMRKGKFPWLAGRAFPKSPGFDIAGVVTQAGSRCKRIQVGDEIFGMLNRWSAGGCAEYVAIPESEVAPKPPSLSMVEAAALPLVSLTALQALRDLLKLQPGESVCINGASGGVGTVAVQIAKCLKAQVIAVCSHRNKAHVQALGADEVLDYAQQSPVEKGRRYDAFFDVFGNWPYDKIRGHIPSPSRYVSTIPAGKNVVREAMARLGLPFPRLVIVQSKAHDLEQIHQWVIHGELKPVVDRTFQLEEIHKAHAYIETKRARGKIVIPMDTHEGIAG